MEMQSRNATAPVDCGNGVWMIDLMEQNLPCRSAAYVLLDDEPTVIDPGSALSHDVLVRGLAMLGLTPDDLAYVVVTHVHLDHAGGAGHLVQSASNAKLVVHPRGARHMADPSRLWQGAAQVYGEQITKLFGDIIPVPEDRILVRHHGDTLNIGKRTLTFFDSPGHAKHHFTILDPLSDALFAGDAAGILYRSCFTGWDFEWILPSTSPVDFDPVAVRQTVNHLRNIPFRWVYHTHFGRSEKARALDETLRGAEAWAGLVADVYRPGAPLDAVVSALRQWIAEDLRRQGFEPGEDLSVLDIDVVLDAMGLVRYQSRRLEGDAT